MSLTPPQRDLFELLSRKERAGEVVSADELKQATGWKPATVRTYLSKKLRPYLSEVESGRYRVNGIASLSEERFRTFLSQSESVRSSVESEGNLERTLREVNPWWRGEPQKAVPTHHRWLFKRLHRSVTQGIAPVTVLRGPRRVGKTVLLRQLINQLKANGVPPERVVYVPFDELPSLLAAEVILKITRWYATEVLRQPLNEGAQPTYFIFDEVQNLADWAAQVKQLADNFQVRILLTGSSSLRIQAEIDRLAGRLSILDLGPLLPREVAALANQGPMEAPFWEDGGSLSAASRTFWQDALEYCRARRQQIDEAFTLYCQRGGYPIAYENPQADWPELAEWLRQNVVILALKHDLVQTGWKDPEESALLFELLRLVCRYAGQSPGFGTLLREVRPSLGDSVSERQIVEGLDFLEGSRLLQRIRPLELATGRTRSPAKLCLCDASLRSAWLQERVSLQDEGPLVGFLAESLLGYALAGIPGLEVSTYPWRSEERPEVDFVVTAGVGRLPLEVKYQNSVDPARDLRGLRSFLENVPGCEFGVLVTRSEVERSDPQVLSIPLSWLLWLR